MASDLCAKQVSIFVENKAGRLADVCDLLGRENINIRGFCVADTSDFGILRLIVNDPNRAVTVLKQHGFAVSETDVLVAQVEDRPGGLAKVVNALREANMNVEYMYAFVTPLGGKAVVVFRVMDELIAQATELLQAEGIPVLEPERVYAL